MKILYVTPLWSGLKPFFLNGNMKATGMPAFYNVFNSFLIDPYVERIFVLLFIKKKHEKLNIPSEYSKKIVVYPIYVNSRFHVYTGILKSIILGIRTAKNEKIEFVYGHGPIAFIASIIGYLSKTRHYRRIYGTFLYDKVKKNQPIFFTDLFEYLSFKLKCNGLIITNDGTHGDKVFHYISNRNTKLHFLLNGINKKPSFSTLSSLKMDEKYFTYIARIDEWKRQDLLLEALYITKQKGVSIPHTYLIGPIYDENYNIKLTNLIKKFSLNKDVTIMGAIETDKISTLLKKSVISFSLYDYSNLGNVFLEGLSVGALICAINIENSLDIFPANIFLNIDSPNPKLISELIVNVLQGNIDINGFRNRAFDYAQKNLLSVKERVDVERDILFND